MSAQMEPVVVDLSSGMSSLDESQFMPLAQEVAILGVFFLSFFMWRHLKEQSSQLKLGTKIAEASAARKLDTATPDARIRRVGDNQHLNNTRRIAELEELMTKYLDQREFTRALNMYRTLERDGTARFISEAMYSSFIQSAVRVGKLDVVDRMVRSLRRYGIKPSQLFWQTIMKMLSSRKHFSSCLAAYDIWEKQIPCDKIVYSCLINASLELDVPERAASMLEHYEHACDEAKEYVLFFRTYLALGDADAAEACFRRLGRECTSLMLNHLLLTCVHVKDAPRAHRLLREAHRFEDEASQCTAPKMVDAVSYNTVIKGYALVSAPKACFECFYEMLERKLEPDDITFGTLLDACIVGNKMCAATELVKLLSDRPMDTVLSTIFIKGLVRGNRISKALELHEEFKNKEGAHLDVMTYSVLIKALVDEHDLQRALLLLEDMRTAGMEVDDIILTHLLEGCRHEGNHALGKKLFDEAINAGLKPSEFTLVTMLKLHGRCGAHQEAIDLVRTWEGRYESAPSVIHYTCIMSGCLRTKQYNLAWATYELMCERGVSPDTTTFNTLLPGTVAAKRWDRALILVRKALAGAGQTLIGPEILNNALSQMLSDADGGDATAAEGSVLSRRCADELRQIMRDTMFQ
jgi:pentatricopeptide repeat protein